MKKLIAACLMLIPFTLTLAAELSPEKVEGATTVDTAQAKKLFDQGVTFIDVRRTNEYEEARIPGAIGIELKHDFNEENLAKAVGKDQPVVFYCNGPKCLRSSKASAMAVGWGWTKVYYYRDGMPAWQAAGMPVE